jgi:hypothetical protein
LLIDNFQRDVKLIEKEQRCAKLEANQANSEIVAKVEDAERKAKKAANTEATCFLTLSSNYLMNKSAFSVAKGNGTIKS